MRRLRALIPVGVTATDSGAFIIGVVAGGRTSTLLEAAHVALYPRGSGAPLGIATDDRGRFVLGPVAPGSYRLRLQQIGYERVWHDLELRARVIDTICANLPEQYKRLIGDCITAEGLVRCPEVAPDSAALGRPNVRCS